MTAKYLRISWPVSAAVTLAILLSACDAGPNCFIIDRVTVLRDGIELGGKTHTLVHRLSGFEEKVDYYELFEGKPDFDICGHTQARPIASDVYEPEHGFIKELTLSGSRLEIHYMKDGLDAPPRDKPPLRVE